MSSKGSNLMKSAQAQKTKQTIEQLLEWSSKKQEFFKMYIPIQQSLIKKLLAAPEKTMLRLKDIAQIAAQEKEIQALTYEKIQKATIINEQIFMPQTEEKVDPQDTKRQSKIKQEAPTWSNNIDRILLSMSRSYKERKGKVKQIFKILDGIQSEMTKEEQRYRSQMKKQQKQLQKLFEKLDEHQKEASKVLGKIIKQSKGQNIKYSAFFIGEIKNIEKHLHGEYDCIIERNKILVKLVQNIIKNEKTISKKVKEQLTIFLNYRRQHYGKQSKADEEVWGFLAIAQERIEEQRLRYFNAALLKPERIQKIKTFLQGDFKNNWQVIVKFIEMSKADLMKPISAAQQMTKLMKNISYRCWDKISLAQGWLIESYTPAIMYMTYDHTMIIYDLSGELLKKINTNSSKVKKTEGQTVFLQEKQKGFFSDSIEEYKLRFEEVQRLEQFQLFIQNQVK